MKQMVAERHSQGGDREFGCRDHMVKEDVKEEERSAELYVSVHGGLDHTFLIKISQA